MCDSEGLSEVQEILWREIDRRNEQFNVCDMEIYIKHAILLQLDKMLLMVGKDIVV